MPKIKILDENTACRIAAGEVVERPVSVVKELVENSLDAGADTVTVTLVGGGVDSITVVDNGCGISQEDTPLAFHRHATSKIYTANDLSHIETLGFRGEALPSIAAVSDLLIKTRTPENDEGYVMRIRGGAITEFGPVGCPVGTSVALTDLFFNTPARRKHLKTKSTEGGLIADLIYKLSLIRPAVRFAMVQRGREVFRSPGAGKMLDAMAAVYGVEAAGMMVPVNAAEGDFDVEGFVSKPELNRSTRQQITVAVNGRLVRSNTVNQALDEAYKGLITIGRYPVAVLHLKIPSGMLDVNVHPAKTEVKIENEEQLTHIISTSVREALQGAGLIPAARATKGGSPGLSATAEPFKLSFPATVAERYTTNIGGGSPLDRDQANLPDMNEIKDVDYGNLALEVGPGSSMGQFEYVNEELNGLLARNEVGQASNLRTSDHLYKRTEVVGDTLNKSMSAEKQVRCRGVEFPELQVVGQLLNMYIICQNEGGMYLIDQHAAHERVLFEKYHAQLRNNTPEVQYLLAPLSLNLRTHEKELLREYMGELEALGFILDDFGRDSLLLRGIPGDISPGKSGRLIADLVETILEKGKPDGLGIKFALAALLACKAAVKAGEKLALRAMQSLIEQLAAAKEPFTCPHGRPTLVSISGRQLSVMFKRT